MSNAKPNKADKVNIVKKVSPSVQSEIEAMQNFQDSAGRTIKTIAENHFHLRLWEAVATKKKRRKNAS